MAVMAFLSSVVVTGVVGALIPGNVSTSRMDQADYHYVPYAGDVFGA